MKAETLERANHLMVQMKMLQGDIKEISDMKWEIINDTPERLDNGYGFNTKSVQEAFENAVSIVKEAAIEKINLRINELQTEFDNLKD